MNFPEADMKNQLVLSEVMSSLGSQQNEIDRQWILRNLVRGIEWSNGTARIELKSRDNNLNVILYPNDMNGRNDKIVLYASFCRFRKVVTIQDLQGGWVGNPYSNKHYCTLVVNLMIQCLRVLFFGELGCITVEGTLYSKLNSDDPKRNEDVKKRLYFWSRFGFFVENTVANRSSKPCKLSDLAIVKRDDIDVGLSTTLSLKAFWLPINRPVYIESDKLFVENFTKDSEVALDIPSMLSIRKREQEQKQQFLKLTLLVFVSVLSIILSVLSPYLNITTVMMMISTAMIFAYFGAKYINRYLSRLAPNTDAAFLRKQREKLLLELEDIVGHDNGALSRVYNIASSVKFVG